MLSPNPTTGKSLTERITLQMTIPRDFPFDKLMSEDKLVGMSLVTLVTTCPSYAFYLTSESV